MGRHAMNKRGVAHEIYLPRCVARGVNLKARGAVIGVVKQVPVTEKDRERGKKFAEELKKLDVLSKTIDAGAKEIKANSSGRQEVGRNEEP